TFCSSPSLRLHRYIPLSLPATHHGARAVDRGAQDDWVAAQRSRISRGGPLLGKDFWHQLRVGGCDWHSDGIPVWHQLVNLFTICGRGHWTDAGHGRHVRLLPGIVVPRIVSLWREAAEPESALAVVGRRLCRIVVVRLLHHCDGRFHAASRRLFHGCGREPATGELLGFRAESVGGMAICAQHVRRGDYWRIHYDGGGRVLFALREVDRACPNFREDGRDRRLRVLRFADFSDRRRTRQNGHRPATCDSGGDGGIVSGPDGRATGHRRSA